MRRPVVAVGVLLSIGVLLGAAVSAQRPPAPAAGGRAWTGPRTIDGQPDMQGFWTNDTYTPLERPAEFAGKEWFTAEEAAAYARRRLEQFLAQPRDSIHYDDAIWQGENYTKSASLRTSLIVEPRDGRLPPLTPGAAAREARRAEERRRSPSDSAQHRTLAERCISWGNVGPPMIPPTYNANMQIVQAPGLVVIRHELMHDVRMIPLDGSPHPGPRVQRLAGDSRGRWEGGTLVVDTTNFTEKTNFRGPPLTTRQDISATEALHVVERFTPLDARTIRYEFTVEDPDTWTRPWSGEMSLRRFEGPIYEYACHEGNYGLVNILRGARVADAASPGAN
jgi:hypothetical protein